MQNSDGRYHLSLRSVQRLTAAGFDVAYGKWHDASSLNRKDPWGAETPDVMTDPRFAGTLRIDTVDVQAARALFSAASGEPDDLQPCQCCGDAFRFAAAR